MADIAAVNWNEVDASNTAAAPDGAIENMAPSGVNNVLRAHQGAIKRMWKRNSVMTTTGTAGAYLVTHTVPPSALADGEVDLIQFHAANSAGATLNVGALGAIPLHYYSSGAWRLLPAGLWGADQIGRVAYHASSAAYRLLDLPDRTGEVVTYAGATAPAGTLLCYGQAISRTAYAGLFAALSTAHGVGDGSSTFNLPDLRGRVGAGKGDMGGSESGRLNGQIASTLGAGGGAQSESATISGTAAVSGDTALGTVIMGGPDLFSAAESGGGFNAATFSHKHSLVFSMNAPITGTTAAATNVQPTLVLNYVIRI